MHCVQYVVLSRADLQREQNVRLVLHDQPAPTLFNLAYHGLDDRAINQSFASLMSEIGRQTIPGTFAGTVPPSRSENEPAQQGGEGKYAEPHPEHPPTPEQVDAWLERLDTAETQAWIAAQRSGIYGAAISISSIAR